MIEFDLTVMAAETANNTAQIDGERSDNEIIKALECCSSHSREIKCDYCLALSDGKCKLNTRQILDLINRQQAEIERLKKENDVLREDNHILATEYANERNSKICKQ